MQSQIETLTLEFARNLQNTLRESVLETIEQAFGNTNGHVTAKITLRGEAATGSAKTRRSRTSPKAKAAHAETILAYVKKHPGERSEQITEGTEIKSKLVRKTLATLRAEKQVKTKGQRRGMTYSVGAARA